MALWQRVDDIIVTDNGAYTFYTASPLEADALMQLLNEYNDLAAKLRKQLKQTPGAVAVILPRKVAESITHWEVPDAAEDCHQIQKAARQALGWED